MTVIEILTGFPDGSLKMSDDGYTEIAKGKSLKWKIKDGTEQNSIQVTSFKIRIKTNSNDEIFSEPPAADGKEWKAKIKEKGVDYKTCEYAIHWKDASGEEFVFDPIIAVKPVP